MVYQISVSLVDQQNRMMEVTDALAKANIDIRSFFMSDSCELRLIVNRPDDAVYLLSNKGFKTSKSAVIVVAVPDASGALDRTIGVLADNNISVEYLYAFAVKTSDDAVIVIKVNDIKIALEIYARENIRVLSPKEVYEF